MADTRKTKVEVKGETVLRWPDGWERTRVGDWDKKSAWKKTYGEYEAMLAYCEEQIKKAEVFEELLDWRLKAG